LRRAAQILSSQCGANYEQPVFMKNFREVLEGDGIYVFDGAIGTRFYDKGIYINRSYDELNLISPDLVREVHAEYVKAGADIIETNTFGATRHRLQAYSLENKLREINIAGAKLAREAAGETAFVAGAIGPLDLRIEPYGPTSFDEAKAMFAEQISALLEGGIDLFLLETFSDLSEIQQANPSRPRTFRFAGYRADDDCHERQNHLWRGRGDYHAAARRIRRGCHRIKLRCRSDAYLNRVRENARRDDETAFRAAERRSAARRAGQTILYVFARIYVEVR